MENRPSEEMYSLHSPKIVRRRNVLITFIENCSGRQMYSLHSSKITTVSKCNKYIHRKSLSGQMYSVGQMSSFANYWIISKTSSRRERVTGIHGCAIGNWTRFARQHKVDSCHNPAYACFCNVQQMQNSAFTHSMLIKPSNGEF